MNIQSLAGEWCFRQAGTDEWLSASVPGSVHTDLLALGYPRDLNRLDWLRDAKQNQTDFDYDRAGNLTEITYPDNTTQDFDYDEVGNLTNATNRRRHAIQFTYKDFGQVTRKTYPNGQLVNYTYDAIGRLTSVTDAKGTISLEYDTRSLLTRIEYPSEHAFSYTYNNARRRTQSESSFRPLVHQIRLRIHPQADLMHKGRRRALPVWVEWVVDASINTNKTPRPNIK